MKNGGLSKPPVLDQQDIPDYIRKSMTNVISLQTSEMRTISLSSLENDPNSIVTILSPAGNVNKSFTLST